MNYENGGGVNLSMPVVPAYQNVGYGGNNGFGLGGDGVWLLLFLLCMGNGMWGGFGGGMLPMMMGMGGFGGMMGMEYLYPWLNNSQNINGGFRDQQISTQISDIRSDINGGFRDTALGIAGVNQAICQTGNNVVNAVTGAQNALAQQMYSNQIADMERSYNAQTAQMQANNALQAQLAQCCCDNRAATADLKYTVATENCADRTQAMQNTRDIIDSQTRSTQAILDKLCQLELDGVKGQLAQAQRDNVGLQNQLNMAAFRESQANQNAYIQHGLNNEVDALYNRLKNCPVPTQPVYGNQPIFTCQPQGGCGCNSGFAAA